MQTLITTKTCCVVLIILLVSRLASGFAVTTTVPSPSLRSLKSVISEQQWSTVVAGWNNNDELSNSAVAWASSRRRGRWPLYSTVDELGGVETFDRWLSESATRSSKYSLSLVRHGRFSNGRGLEYVGKVDDGEYDETGAKKKTKVISIPQELVLRSTIVEDKDELQSLSDDWDASLAVKLLTECRLGPASKLYGYCNLLMRSETPAYFATATATATAPPSTAPDAIRNWSPNQLSRLSASTRGKRLLSALAAQSDEWADKYLSLPPSTRSVYSPEQFTWAMEAVHSRAFRGDFGGRQVEEGLVGELSRKLLPASILAIGLSYYVAFNLDVPDWAAVGLFFVAFSPQLVEWAGGMLGVESDRDAVLLPFVDSANHRGAVDSVVELDPLGGVFTVSIDQEGCVIKDTGGEQKNQLYISYGNKGDAELLLNYGFLENMDRNDLGDVVKEEEEGGEEPRDGVRKLLAETFIERGL